MVKFLSKLRGSKRRLFAALCLSYQAEAAQGLVNDGNEIPIFCWLSPYQRIKLVRDICVGLLCENEPLPPNTIQHYAAFQAIVHYGIWKVRDEIDECHKIEGVSADLLLAFGNERFTATDEADSDERARNFAVVANQAERNQRKMRQEDRAEIELPSIPISRQRSTALWIRDFLYEGGPIPRRERAKLNKRIRKLSFDEKKAFRYRLLLDEIMQEDDSPSISLRNIGFDFRCQSYEKWFQAIVRVFFGESAVLEPSQKDIFIVCQNISEVHLADPAHIPRIQAVEQNVELLLRVYESTWKRELLSDDQRCIVALSIHDNGGGAVFGNESHRKWFEDFHNRIIDGGNPSTARVMDYQRRFDIYKEIKPLHPEGLDTAFQAPGPGLPFNHCSCPSVFKPISSWIRSQRCSREGCTSCETENLRRCPDCKVVRYCSVDCQKNDWKRHKKQCAELRALRKDKAKVADLAKDLQRSKGSALIDSFPSSPNERQSCAHGV